MNAVQKKLPSAGAAPAPDLASYHAIVVPFSGGKDSLAAFLHLLECGVPRDKIELWHHEVDGREGSQLMDWPVTSDYCRKVAQAFGVKLYYSWKVGGFEREMLRQRSRTAPITFEQPLGGRMAVGGERGTESTRLRFPQVSSDLSVRWCSAYLKIDVCAAAIRNQPRFERKRTLVVTGERAQESNARARYAVFEKHKADNRFGRARRHVDHWRPVHAWREPQVWEIIARHRVNPHPAYRLGWGRVSCMTCIFGSCDQWASIRRIAPDRFRRIAELEAQFGSTIHRKKTVQELADSGTPYETMRTEDVSAALCDVFGEPVILAPGAWRLPAGAYADAAGPT